MKLGGHLGGMLSSASGRADATARACLPQLLAQRSVCAHAAGDD